MSDQPRLDTIGTSVDVSVSITVPNVTATCPVDGHTDHYRLTIEYVPKGELVEYSSLAEWCDSLSGTEITHEALVDHTARTVRRSIGTEELQVTAKCVHYGLDVEVVNR